MMACEHLFHTSFFFFFPLHVGLLKSDIWIISMIRCDFILSIQRRNFRLKKKVNGSRSNTKLGEAQILTLHSLCPFSPCADLATETWLEN